MSAESAHMSIFGAATETEAEIRSTCSPKCFVHVLGTEMTLDPSVQYAFHPHVANRFRWSPHDAKDISSVFIFYACMSMAAGRQFAPGNKIAPCQRPEFRETGGP